MFGHKRSAAAAEFWDLRCVAASEQNWPARRRRNDVGVRL